MTASILLLLAAVVLPIAAGAQTTAPAAPTYNGRASELKVRPPRLEEGGSTVDGNLNEAQWSRAALLTGFSLFAPNDGLAADDSTEVLVWYSATAIHFGVRAFERHGAPRATLADRDRIWADDNIQILLGTFNDGRQATVFAVNPLGIQADGTIVESNQAGSSRPGSTSAAREPTDPSADFVFDSKGRITPDGYVVEIRIPFKSLKYQSAEVQTWGLNVVRQEQHSGHEDSWAPAKRSGLSFLAQSGALEGLTDLHRGLVVDVNPELTQRTTGGTRRSLPYTYDRGRPALGGNARWGITNNLTLNGTINPDFSQIESDAGQFAFDPRNALYFSEKRPFFLDGIEQFAVPHQLIYTRQIVQPVVAAKLAGKLSGTGIAFLSAVDETTTNDPRIAARHPVFNLLRLQRDLGTSSKIGMVYTDVVHGGDYNRVADVDGSYVFRGVYSLQGQYAQSFTSEAGTALNAPLWHGGFNRNGKHFSMAYSIDGVHENFRTGSGFISRTGVVQTNFDHRFTVFGAPGALVEAVTFSPAYFGTWRYQSFVHQGDAIEKKLHFSMSSTLRGGWNAGLGYFVETFGFDPDLFGNYAVQGAGGQVLPFVGTDRIPNSEAYISFATPGGNRLAANAFYLWGRDENFYEWASSNIIIASYGLTFRPTDKLRLNATYNLQSFNRRSDGSIVGNNRIPRLKLEYQIARPIFVRLVGEYDSFFRDALRDEGRTGLPVLVNGRPTVQSTNTSFRGDFLFSYQPNPGTVVFLGYGAGYADARTRAEPFEFPRSLGLTGYQRSDDALFVKASYLFRL